MVAVPRAQRLPKATETKAEPGSTPSLGHIRVEPSVAGVWTKGHNIKVATQGDFLQTGQSETLANLAFHVAAAALPDL